MGGWPGGVAILVTNPPCIIHEDEHLLVVNKPPGMNTHAPSPYHGEGFHEWLKHREPRWSSLAIIHRLDKQTSGVMVFAKTPQANRSLTEQFATRKTRKTYHLLSRSAPSREHLIIRSNIVRLGEKYQSGPKGEFAETHFRSLGPLRLQSGQQMQIVEAQPLTGRTHQIRVHASEQGFPILGDETYGGEPFDRVCLHAATLEFFHPVSRERLSFSAPAQFEAAAAQSLRSAFIEPGTDAFRVWHGASDGHPGFYLERWGDFLLLSGENEPSRRLVSEIQSQFQARGLYFKILNRRVRATTVDQAAPRLLSGDPAPEAFEILENGVRFEASFQQGYSVGLFLDQRDNRRRFLIGQIAASFPGLDFKGCEILNTFAYTCGFSVCAGLAGARATSLDLSRKYLDWGRRNFTLNQLDPTAHDFIFGDVFEWAARFLKSRRQFHVIITDPPTFSQAKGSGVFQAEKDYGRLISSLLPLLAPGGILLASTNAQKFRPEEFLKQVQGAVAAGGRKIAHQHYFPQPPDFPVSREEPAYLKTVWVRIT